LILRQAQDEVLAYVSSSRACRGTTRHDEALFSSTVYGGGAERTEAEGAALTPSPPHCIAARCHSPPRKRGKGEAHKLYTFACDSNCPVRVLPGALFPSCLFRDTLIVRFVSGELRHVT